MEIYICMASMMMLSISIGVSVNIELPLKGRPQAWLGHSWALFRPFRLLGTLGIGKLCPFGLWAKFTKSKEIMSWTNI